MAGKQWLKHFIYLVVVIILVLIRVHFMKLAKAYSNETFLINYYFLSMVILTNILLGILLGVEHLISEMKAKGTWKINFPKLILLGVPALYFSIAYVAIYSQNTLVQYIFSYPLRIFLTYDTSIFYIFQLIFGYVIITSFCKKVRKSNNFRTMNS